MKSALTCSTIVIKPSSKLFQYLKDIKCKENLEKVSTISSYLEMSSLLTNSDREFINSLDLSPEKLDKVIESIPIKTTELLNIPDLISLSENLREQQKSKNSDKPHFHELMVGSEIIFPQNEEIPRSEVLEKRCILLKRQHENRIYKAMTKDVDSVRKHLPEDTIAYQLKHLNRQLIAIGQFLISVFAGFMFGFQGIEMMVGPFDFGFRLLLGVMCSLTIALAELYFLAKKLNENLQYKSYTDTSIPKHEKVD